MLAMQTHCDPSACALQCDELHCWYNDAEDVADVALRIASVAEPDIDVTALQVCECHATGRLVRGLEVQVDVESIGTAPTTPRNRRNVDGALQAQVGDDKSVQGHKLN